MTTAATARMRPPNLVLAAGLFLAWNVLVLFRDNDAAGGGFGLTGERSSFSSPPMRSDHWLYPSDQTLINYTDFR